MLYCDINDYQLAVYSSTGQVLVSQPVAAARDGKKLVFGQAALAISRSHPQQFNNRYFYSLAAEPLSGDLRPAKNYADLIFHHLKSLDLPKEPIAMGVGGHVTNTQLGLLLGICQEADIQVAGFVDLALVNCLAITQARHFHVLDIESHRLVLNRVEVDNESYAVTNTIAFDGLGSSGIVSGWMNILADEFVQKTRFDPLHAGGTEQQLFDQVNAWLNPGVQITPRIEIQQNDASRDIEVNTNLLTQKLSQRLEALDLSDVEVLYLTPRASTIPGLPSLLDQRVGQIGSITEADITTNYAALADLFSVDQVRRIVRADRRCEIDNAQGDAVTSPAAVATHLLNSSHVAVAISAVEGISAELQPGDSIEIGVGKFTAIRLE